jgi:hypothetical protein
MRNRWSEGKKLNFAESLSYPACRGYKDPVAASEATLSADNLSQPDSVQVQQAVKESSKITEIIFEPSELSMGKEKVIEETSAPKETLFEQPRSLDGLDEVVDDIAYRFWECGRCLSMGHDSKSCTKRVRCRFCFTSGHFRKTCLDWLKQKNQCWVPKVGLSPQISPDTGPSAVSTSAPGHQDTLIAETESCPPPPPPPTDLPRRSAMANFELNPAHWVPHGFHIIDGGPTRLPRSLYNATVAPAVTHGNYCVAQLNPPPQQQDEIFWRDIIRDFIVNHHQRAVENM